MSETQATELKTYLPPATLVAKLQLPPQPE